MQPVAVQIPNVDFGPSLNDFFHFLSTNYPQFFFDMARTLGFLDGLAIVLSFIFLVGIILSIERIKVIRKKEEEIYDAHVVPVYDEASKADPELSLRWRKVLEHVDSQNQNDWRQAIIEADIILEDILSRIGYQGEGSGEKLKSADKADFQTLDQAWEAHKIRNTIAHEGSSFLLSQHEAKRVVNLYKQVFEEFYYI